MSAPIFSEGEVIQFNGWTPSRVEVTDATDPQYVWGIWLSGTHEGEEDGFPWKYCEKIEPEIKEESTVIEYNIAALDLAAEYGRTVEFGYQKEGSFVTERRSLNVESVSTSFHSGETIVVGWDSDRREPRAFRVDRITDDVVVR